MVASNEAQLGPSTDARAERYRHAERRFWGHYGLAPVERFVEVGLSAGTAAGAGARVGRAGAVRERHRRSRRLLRPAAARAAPLPVPRVLDRPGWGLSAPVDYSAASYRTLTAELLRQSLDALGVDRVDAEGGSIGSLWVLRLAQAPPSRVRRLVLLGAAPLTSEIGVPRFIRLLRSPLGRIITRVPENRRMLGKQLAALGHTAGSGPGQIPEAFVDWHLAMSRETDWPGTSARWSGVSSAGAATWPTWCSRTTRSPASSSRPCCLRHRRPNRVARRLATVHRPRPAGRAGGRGRRWSPGLVPRPHPHRRPRDPVPRQLEGGHHAPNPQGPDHAQPVRGGAQSGPTWGGAAPRPMPQVALPRRPGSTRSGPRSR